MLKKSNLYLMMHMTHCLMKKNSLDNMKTNGFSSQRETCIMYVFYWFQLYHWEFCFFPWIYWWITPTKRISWRHLTSSASRRFTVCVGFRADFIKVNQLVCGHRTSSAAPCFASRKAFSPKANESLLLNNNSHPLASLMELWAQY